MLNCWKDEPSARPSFSEIVSILDRLAGINISLLDSYSL